MNEGYCEAIPRSGYLAKDGYPEGIPRSGYLAKDGYPEGIPRSGYYITSTGRKVILESCNIINVSDMGLIELVIPDGVRAVYCWNNNLTELIIPDSVKTIWCWNNKLTKLHLPDSVTEIRCGDNPLTELVIPDKCIGIIDKECKVIRRTMYNRSNRLKQILK